MDPGEKFAPAMDPNKVTVLYREKPHKAWFKSNYAKDFKTRDYGPV